MWRRKEGRVTGRQKQNTDAAQREGKLWGLTGRSLESKQKGQDKAQKDARGTGPSLCLPGPQHSSFQCSAPENWLRC